MKEKNKHNLNKAIEQLAVSQADSRIWDKIEIELDNEFHESKKENLKNAIRSLQINKAPEHLWAAIETEISNNLHIIQKPKRRVFFRAAASVALIIALGFLIKLSLGQNTSKETVEFSKESVSQNLVNNPSQELADKLTDMVQGRCKVQPDICKDPEFIELNEELADLNKSLIEIKQTYEKSNSDPEIYKYIMRIEKEKGKISKKLFQYFNS